MRDLPFLGRPEPVLGQGTWTMGDASGRRAGEVAALCRGIDLGCRVIDTAEMYGDGASEELVGEAIAGRRDAVTLVSKVLPSRAGRRDVPNACEASLRRLRVERLDLYLLHWRGSVPLAETVDAFERLREAGKIGAWGVSNFDVDDLEELHAAGGTACAANQILYNVARRGPEFALLPWMARHGIAAMAYSPLEQGRIPGKAALEAVAARHEASTAAVMLAFALRSGSVLAIPKAGSVAHVEANSQAAELTLTPEDMAALDAAFPPPRAKSALAML